MRLKASLAMTLFLACACISTTPDFADAARLGGGRSFGSQPAMRQSAPAPVQRSQSMQQQRQTQQNTPQRSGFLGGMGGILGGLLAGTLIGSLLSGAGFSGGGFLDIILLALAGFIVFKLFFSRRRAAAPAPAAAAPGGMAAPQAPYQPLEREDVQATSAGDAWGGLRSQSDAAPAGPVLPAGFDADEFLRGAKMAYTRLQKAWDARDLNDIAQFASPAVMEAIREQLQVEPNPSVTELLLVNAQLLEVTQEAGGVERAQVYFDVLMREDPRQETPSSVREIWHFMREGAQGMWRLDGIQQVAQ